MILKKVLIHSDRPGTTITTAEPEVTFTIPEGKSVVVVRADLYESRIPPIEITALTGYSGGYQSPGEPINIGIKALAFGNSNYYTEIDINQFGYFASGDEIKVLTEFRTEPTTISGNDVEYTFFPTVDLTYYEYTN